MNLKKYAICACALASTSAFAAQYLYNGGDANSASGYLEITDGTVPFIAIPSDIHLYPTATREKTTSQAGKVM